jgi:hypothetical protein
MAMDFRKLERSRNFLIAAVLPEQFTWTDLAFRSLLESQLVVEIQ